MNSSLSCNGEANVYLTVNPYLFLLGICKNSGVLLVISGSLCGTDCLILQEKIHLRFGYMVRILFENMNGICPTPTPILGRTSELKEKEKCTRY
jgi:hypothetical protein